MSARRQRQMCIRDSHVSHASALEAKRACKLLQTPYMPVKSSGLGALATALTEIHSD